MKGPFLICILGPTAVGKSEIGMNIALKYGCDIISADSRQIYEGMDIGTAAPGFEDLRQVRHHFIGFRKPDNHVSAGEFEKIALDEVYGLFTKNQVQVLVGGSGLFVEALLEGFNQLPSADLEIRARLEDLFKKEGCKGLAEELKKKDPKYYSIVDLKNHRRLIRALELIELTGLPFSTLIGKSEPEKRKFSPIKIGLERDRGELYDRIDKRVDRMLEMGLLEEVKTLKHFESEKALNTVGYKELFDFLDGNSGWEEAIELIKRNSRHYAKRQMTWFKKDKDIKWFSPKRYERIEDYVEKIISGAGVQVD
jgi:tRNA dimethylallyltransferase